MAFQNKIALFACLVISVISQSVVAQDVFPAKTIELGPRPFYLINQMDESELKTKLMACQNKKMKKPDFSIGHRGAAMQFPEHTEQSYLAAAKMGAGIIECDVTFTKDEELVCRHSQCDLHTTTNILAIPELAKKCTVPFEAAKFDLVTGELIEPAHAQCCTTDITLAEFKQLEGKMDASNKRAKTPEEFMGGTANWRTDLYATKGTVMTHAQSIELFKQLKVKMTPELKSASVAMPYQNDFSQDAYAKKMIEDYIAAGVNPNQVYPQSFNIEDVRFWIKHYPQFGKQAVLLDDMIYKDDPNENLVQAAYQAQIEKMSAYKAEGINFLAPPLFGLIELDSANNIVASQYAKAANENNIGLIAWTLERSGLLKNNGGWYYQTVNDVIDNDGQIFEVLDVLAKEANIAGMFSDWPATVTYYDNCIK